jgi:hypothetical protein
VLLERVLRGLRYVPAIPGLKAICATFPDARMWRGGNIEIAEFGLWQLRHCTRRGMFMKARAVNREAGEWPASWASAASRPARLRSPR